MYLQNVQEVKTWVVKVAGKSKIVEVSFSSFHSSDKVMMIFELNLKETKNNFFGITF